MGGCADAVVGDDGGSGGGGGDTGKSQATAATKTPAIVAITPALLQRSLRYSSPERAFHKSASAFSAFQIGGAGR